ncbi:hypothetical protein PHYSODRAFT_333162 [Phytophthora sojae]|uniref:Uncharacterized protein n=1 Tax=Phytophthora sojae (strain P6497) TaxID=1094619 RepID=G4ZK36_PHYSP|nr:hypothetical protein PHYSODRAFT_333162 [Phytophthora sojae]EGZ14840.1 hypothetical protein PHYSODRAFT_333162 [Phytophthora sojae]|eukprot:XP_009528589.1 hypothetical protein PHYSODRAFT_333162 [Phytophthora sojae]
MQPGVVPPLLVVELLFRAKSDFTDLPHATTSVSQFLDSSVELPLHKACAFESLRLLDRIWTSSRAYKKNSVRDGASFSLGRCLGTDRYYRHHQFNRSLLEAVKRRHLAMVMWLSSKLKGYLIEGEVVTAAASVGAIEILDFFLCWGPDALEVAVLHGHSNVMWWLLQHTPDNGYDMDKALHYASEGHNIVHEVAAQGRLDVLKWMQKKRGVDLDAGSNGSHITDLGEASLAIHVAAVNGHLQAIQLRRLTEALGGSCTAAKVTIDTVVEAGKNGHADVVQWLLAEYPKLNFGDQQTPTDETPMDAIAARGHLNVLVVVQTMNVNADSRKRNRDGSRKGGHVCTSKAMDDAAANGHLDVVKWLHENRDEGCTSRAMDGAAIGGHLRVIQWLHENTSQGCTTGAMDGAAVYGYLDVVKWLHFTTNGDGRSGSKWTPSCRPMVA